MTEIDSLLRRAAFRLWLGRFLSTLFAGACIALAILVLARVVDRLTALSLDWPAAFVWSGVAVVGLSLAWSIVRRPTAARVALAVDERAGLREALSTALCVRDRRDAWSRAAVGHAAGAAKRVIVRHIFPARAPRLWFAPAVLLGLFFLSGLLPQKDLLGLLRSAEAQTQERAEVVRAKQEVSAITDQLADSLEQIEDEELKNELAEKFEMPEKASPEEVRRAAIRKLTSIKDRLEQLKKSDRARTQSELNKRMKQLRQPGPGPASELSRALQRGDFEGARKHLQELMNRLAEGDLSEEEKQRLREQLENLAKQLEELAKRREQLAEALKQAGMDPDLANASPEEIAKAIQQNRSLSQDQMNALRQLAQQTCEAGGACSNLASAAGAAAAAMAGGEGQVGAFSDLAGQLSELEMTQAELEALNASLAECKACMAAFGQKLGMCEGGGLMPGKGGVKPGWGSARGGPTEAHDDFDTEAGKVRSDANPGPIIGSVMVEGGSVRGESVQQFSQAVEAGAGAAADAIESQRIPREYHDAVKHYFGRLGKQAEEPADDGRGE